jgi:small subunit ribosomal protein S2
MSETTDTPSEVAEAAAPSGSETAAILEETKLSIRALLEAGVHFGHQTRRWNPRMKPFIFGERNGTHIIDLDRTFPMFSKALDHVRQALGEGGKALFVGTKRQAAPWIETEAKRSGQYYVNNRWLGGMLTNWKTVKKSIDRYKNLLEIVGDEEKREALSKKELARVNRQIDKYAKSLEGIKEMSKLPDVVFVIDVGAEEIAVSEARRLRIPVIGIVDTNCSPDGVDFVVPGNDDAIRSLSLYCRLVANACIEGEQAHQEKLRSEVKVEAHEEKAPVPATGRRVVEIKQAPRRGRGDGAGGRTRSSGGWKDKQKKDKQKADAKVSSEGGDKTASSQDVAPAPPPDEAASSQDAAPAPPSDEAASSQDVAPAPPPDEAASSQDVAPAPPPDEAASSQEAAPAPPSDESRS